MGRALLPLAAGVLLAGPAALAFFAGGYFDTPRLLAGIVAWALVLVVAATTPRPLPASTAGRAALGGLVLLCGWSGVSLFWAPLAGPATDSFTRLLLYVGALVAAIALLRDRAAARAVDPALALGALAVTGYGLTGRLLPGVLDLDRSSGAGSRLEQPITYWNAEGVLAGLGLVLCARVAGDRSRPVLMRALASAGCAPLGTALYLTYSRGAIAAAVVGLVVLVAASPSWSQIRAALTALLASLVPAMSSMLLPAVATLEGGRAAQRSEGAILFLVVLAVMLAAGLSTAWIARRERAGRLRAGEPGATRRLPTLAAMLAVLTVAGLVAGGLSERGDPSQLGRREGSARLLSIDSRRYEYWRVAVDELGRDPLIGTGAGGFRVLWLRDRPVAEGVLEVHSLPLETALELGLVGLLGLALFVGGAGSAARTALRVQPHLAAGPVAACSVWLLHATIDWDWQLPAVTLPAIVLAGALIAASEARPAARRTPRRTADDQLPSVLAVPAAREPASASRVD